MKRLTLLGILVFAMLLSGCARLISPFKPAAPAKLRVLIVDGQNNHAWKETTPILKEILEGTGRFAVEVATTPPQGRDMTSFNPRFGDYAGVVCNYTGDPWPANVRRNFAEYVRGGGGAVIFHAADNAFPDWPEWNEIIGLGAWGDRNEKSGPLVYWKSGRIVHDTTAGAAGHHGPQHAFEVINRITDHPITQGLPERWMHGTDELYDSLRGPAKNLTVLSTAYSDPATGGTGRHEPVLMTVSYGKGRVFHTILGHGKGPSMDSVGFRATLARGTEWTATGRVTLPAPANFPAAPDPYAQIAKYDFGGDREWLTKVSKDIVDLGTEPSELAKAEKKLLLVAQSPTASFAARQFACQKLGQIGGAESAKSLGKMLRDDKLSDLARYALESNSDPGAGKALRGALKKATGKTRIGMRIGIINSLGERRDGEAVKDLGRLLASSDKATAQAAAGALGKIGGPKALKALRAAPNQADGAVADAVLMCADSLLREEMTAGAGVLYREVYRNKACPSTTRAAALRGLCRTEPDKMGDTVLELLGSEDAALRGAAITAVREIPGKGITGQFAAKLDSLPAPIQAPLIAALADRGDAAVVPALIRMAKSQDEAVRLAALSGLGQLPGNARVAALLAQTAGGDARVAEQKAAHESLARLQGAGVDRAVLNGAARGGEPAVRRVYIRQCGERNLKASVPALLAMSRESDPEIRAAALGVLRDLGSAAEYPALVEWLIASKEQDERIAARGAVLALARRMDSPDKGVRPLIGALDRAGTSGKGSLLECLGTLGGEDALKAVSAQAKSRDAEVATSAVRALVSWPDGKSLEPLVGIVETTKSTKCRELALAGSLQMLGKKGGPTAQECVGFYKRLLRTGGIEEKKKVLAGLANVGDDEALRLARSCAANPLLKPEAERAAQEIEKVLAGPPAVSASHGGDKAGNAMDRDPDTRWDTGANMQPGMWFMADLKAEKSVLRIVLDAAGSPDDFPRSYQVFVGNDSKNLGAAVAEGKGEAVTTIKLSKPARGRYVKIVQTGSSDENYWSIQELTLETE